MVRLCGVVLGVILAFSCGPTDERNPIPQGSVPAVHANLPSRVLGLRVVEERIGEKLDDVSQTYLQSIGLFSFREDNDLLRGTLQVGKFNEIADNERKRFRDSIIGDLGSTVPIELRVGDRSVFLSAGNEQSLYSWFEPDGFLVLSVRSDYPFARSLLRRLVSGEILS